MKKFLALLMAAMMLLATAGIALADGENEETKTVKYTFTINNKDKEYEYTAYQIFAGDLSDGVLSNITWGSGVTASAADKFGAAADQATQLKTVEDAEAFAVQISEFLATGTASAPNEAGTAYEIKNLEAGYYLIETTKVPTSGGAYSRYIMKVVEDEQADPKTETVSHEKKVKENSTDNYKGSPEENNKYGEGFNDVADYSIGDVVPFSLYSTVPTMKGFETYKMTFHDVMSPGLTLDPESIKVYIGGTEVPAADREIITNTSDKCTFCVTIKDLLAKDAEGNRKYATGAQIRVNFSATLNENAIIGLNGNPNQSKLEYSNNPYDKTETTELGWDYVVVFTYKLDVTKTGKQATAIDETDGKEKPVYINEKGEETFEAKTGDADNAKKLVTLNGAEFVLKNSNNKYYKVTEVTTEVDGESKTTKVVTWVDYEEDATKLTSAAGGKFAVVGLDEGVYSLVETKAPNGYNQLVNPVPVTITATTGNGHEYDNDPAKGLTAIEIDVDGSKATGDVSNGIVKAEVNNKVGATLPETGGIGTTLFYLFGGLMTAGSALMLIVRRRAEAEEE